jgi:hypothetical protein
MSQPLADAWAKYKRADAHADALHREVSLFSEADAIKIIHDGDLETGDYVFWVELLEEPPLREWGLTVGDILHNLHSALDSLAWQLTIAHYGRELTGSEAKSIYFPLSRCPSDFRGWAVLKHVTHGHRRLLQNVQPYQGGYELLSVLADLSRRDKHRAIHPTCLIDDDFSITAKAVRDCEVLRLVREPPGPLEDGRNLARVQGRTTGPEPEIEGEADLKCHVALSDRTPLQSLMDDMGKTVGRVLRTFEPTLSGVLL